jgi:endonuclease/exonuclease/phosphatase family metal-dependent hydrolase
MIGGALRVVTLNLWQEQGPWAERLELAARQLGRLAADVICFQEVRQAAGRVPNQAETLARALGMELVYEKADTWGGGDEGLAVLSRHPIAGQAVQRLPHDEGRSRRICLGVRLSLPGGAVQVFTTHLAYRLTDGALRLRQVREVDRFARAWGQGGAVLLCGDFNAAPDADEIRYLKGLTGIEGERTYYQDAFAVCNPGVEGLTWSRSNPFTEQLDWLPPRRIDYVFVGPQQRNGVGRVLSCRLVCTEPNQRGIHCSDHYGVLADVMVGDR